MQGAPQDTLLRQIMIFYSLDCINSNCRHSVDVHHCVIGVGCLVSADVPSAGKYVGAVCGYHLSEGLMLKFACLHLYLSVNTLSLGTDNMAVIRFSIVCLAACCLVPRKRSLKKTAQ